MPQNKQAFVNAIVQSLGAEQPNRRPLIAIDEVIGLEHKADFIVADARQFVIVCFMDVHPVQRILARGRFVQHADNIHQGTFAGAGFTHNGNEFPRPHSQINAVQDFQLVRQKEL